MAFGYDGTLDEKQGYWYFIDMNRRYPHRPQRSSKNYIRFLVIGVLAMVILDYVFWSDGRPYVDEIVENSESSLPAIDEALSEENTEVIELPEPEIILPENGEAFFQEDSEIEAVIPEIPEVEAEPDTENPLPPGMDPKNQVVPELEQNSQIQFEKPKKKIVNTGPPGKIAIVIDDMGMNLKQSKAAISLPSEI
ncbi:MAG: hypothetical protein AAF549_00570, partial [Pseudomonadota bacterium]